jgi:DNA mismatch repair protein MutH
MERIEAVEKLKQLEGKVLQDLANTFNVTIHSSEGKINKGWAGHVFENFLGLPINSLQSPDFGSWELKSIPLKKLKNGNLSFKETMAITIINSEEVKTTSFENSHLLSKLKKLIVIARIVGSNVDDPSIIHSVNIFDLTGELYLDVKNDYNLVRDTLLNPSLGFDALTGSMGKYIQPRTKGAGHGSKSRAFYARPLFLEQFISVN